MALCGDDHDKVIARINRIEGQVRGLKKMVAEDRDCLQVLKQIAAASGAMRSLGGVILEDHLEGCVATAPRTFDIRFFVEARARDRGGTFREGSVRSSSRNGAEKFPALARDFHNTHGA